MSKTFVSSSIKNAKISTKFMQNYRVAEPISENGAMCTAVNNEGGVELFICGSNNQVFNIYPDTASDTGYSCIQTALRGCSFITAGCDQNNNMVVFSTDGTKLHYVYRSSTDNQWSGVNTVTLNNATRIVDILANTFNGKLYVAVIDESINDHTDDTLTSHYYFLLPFDVKSYPDASSVNGVPEYTDDCHNGLIFLGVLQPFNNVTYLGRFTNMGNEKLYWYFSPGGGKKLICKTSRWPDYFDKLTGCSTDGTIYSTLDHLNIARFDPQNSNPQSFSYPWTIIKQFKSQIIKQIIVGEHIICLTEDNKLYHFSPGKDEEIYPINKNVADVCAILNNNGDLEMYIMEQNQIFHMYKKPISLNWAKQKAEVQVDNHVEEYISYSSDIVIYDDQGSILPSEDVTVWTDEEAFLNINGRTYFLNPKRRIVIKTNVIGKITIVQETNSLAISTIQINIPRINCTFSINQSAGVQSYLASVSDGDIMDAKDINGNYLLDGNYRNNDTAIAISNICKNCASIKGRLLHIYTDSTIESQSLLEEASQKHWSLTFEDNYLIYRELEGQEAENLIYEARSKYKSAKGLFGWLTDIGDFFEGLKEGIIEVSNIVVSKIKACITFVLDGITYVFDTVINSIEQAFDLVEGIWAKVKVEFNKLFEWLGNTFNWVDILRTKEAVAHSINQVMDFLSGAASGIQTILDNNISNLQDQLHDAFTSLNNIVQSQSIGAFAETSKPDSNYDEYLSNNFVLDAVLRNKTNSVILKKGIPVELQGPIDIIMNEISKFSSNVMMNQAFETASTYFTNLGNSPDQIFTNSLSGMLSIVEGLIQAGLAGVQLVVDTVLQNINLLINSLKDMLNIEINLPLITDFYAWLTNGSELTIIDMIALIVSIPTTALYKALKNVAPFVDESKVDEFRTSFTADSILRLTGLKPGFETDAKSISYNDIDFKNFGFTDFVKLLANVSTYLYGIVVADCDFLWVVTPTYFTIAAFILENLAQLLFCPWIYESPSFYQKYYWIWNWLGISIDGIYILLNGHMPENSDNNGRLITSMFATIQMTFGILACNEVNDPPIAIASTIFYSIPGICKLLLNEDIVSVTHGISLAVCSFIDCVFYSANAAIGVILIFAPYNETTPVYQ